MQTPFEAVKEFHEAYLVRIAEQADSNVPDDVRKLRVSLIAEEYAELMEALETNDLVLIADALADLTYVVYGTAVSYGIPLDEVFAEVHRSNMSKLDVNGEPIFREDGKVLKGPNFTLPNLEPIVYGTQAPTSLL